jgi:hypothetical protein
VLRRSLVLMALSGLVLVLASTALAASVRVRVEGRTQTIFGATEPRALAGNALEALDAASRGGEFYYGLTTTSFGTYVSQIGRYAGSGTAGWVFKVNGESPPVGADQVQLKDGDVVLWYWADFASGTGPKTLRLTSRKAGCYRVEALDDKGAAGAATGAVLRIDGRTVKASATETCVGPHRGLVRATAPGMVRSNALR